MDSLSINTSVQSYGVTPTFLCHTDQQRCESSGWMGEEVQEARSLSPSMSKGNRTLFWVIFAPGNLFWLTRQSIQGVDGGTKKQMAFVVRGCPHFDAAMPPQQGREGLVLESHTSWLTFTQVRMPGTMVMSITPGGCDTIIGSTKPLQVAWRTSNQASVSFSPLVRASVCSWTNCC